MPSAQHQFIFEKYFPPGTEETVEAVFKSIVGDNIHTGSTAFSRLLVDVNDSNNVCGLAGTNFQNYVNRNGTIITICPLFWEKFGDQPERTCADLPDDIVSWQMVFAGDAILNMVLGYIGTQAVNDKDVINFHVQSSLDYTGPANAMYIRAKFPDTAIYSLSNYDWYAIVSETRRRKLTPG